MVRFVAIVMELGRTDRLVELMPFESILWLPDDKERRYTWAV